MSQSAPVTQQDLSSSASAPNTPDAEGVVLVTKAMPLDEAQSSPLGSADAEMPESGIREIYEHSNSPWPSREAREAVRLGRVQRIANAMVLEPVAWKEIDLPERIALWEQRAVGAVWGTKKAKPRVARVAGGETARMVHPALDPETPLENPPVDRPPRISLFMWFWLAVTGA